MNEEGRIYRIERRWGGMRNEERKEKRNERR